RPQGRQEDGAQEHAEDGAQERGEEDGPQDRSQEHGEEVGPQGREAPGEEGGRQAPSCQEGREEDRPQGGEASGCEEGREEGPPPGEAQGRPGGDAFGARADDVSSSPDCRKSSSPSAAQAEGEFFCAGKSAPHPALRATFSPQAGRREYKHEGRCLRGYRGFARDVDASAPYSRAFFRSTYSSSTSFSSRSSQSPCRPSAASRTVGISPLGTLLVLFHNTTTPRSRSGTSAIVPRYPCTAPPW